MTVPRSPTANFPVAAEVLSRGKVEIYFLKYVYWKLMVNGFHISDQTIGSLSTELRLNCTIFPLPDSPWIPATSLFGLDGYVRQNRVSFSGLLNFHYSASFTWCVFGPEALKGVQRQQMSGLHLWHQRFFPNNSVPWYYCKKIPNSECKTKRIRVEKYGLLSWTG